MAHRQPQPPPPIKSLSPKRQRFVDEYLIDLNATQAAIRAGYSRRTAEQQGYRLLRNVQVAAAVAEGQARIAAKLMCLADDVARELHKLGFANMLDYMVVGPDGDPRLDFSRLTRDQKAALAEVTVDAYIDGRGSEARAVKRVKFRLCDKRAALVDVAKLLGFMPERHELTGKDGGPVQLGEIVTYRAEIPDNGRNDRPHD